MKPTINAKTILGFRMPFDFFTSPQWVRLCTCPSSLMIERQTNAGIVNYCEYHKSPWAEMVDVLHPHYNPADKTFMDMYSVVLPLEAVTNECVVGVDIGYVYLNLDSKSGMSVTTFDCVSRSLDMLAAEFNLEDLSLALDVEYDDLRVFTVMYVS